MIDPQSETLIALRDAATILPRTQPRKRRNGKEKKTGPQLIAFATVWRWAMKGVRSLDGQTVRLETLRLGGKLITSKEAVSRFIISQSPPDPENSIQPMRSPSKRARAVENAERQLAAAGI